ncbi:MarR family winged helix-turn-helix transcriptional regulator [Actinoplanes regularis]|uniref:MarR family winged helix-turn-helix transcriptional regulator n=1 Tax=Actinoplanes regularis TaxID=52697 RepID=UPI0024A0C02B|nr:MarR family transcriptional regulator [Actinoplanes regularis]GLW28412.1 MarR family transcriptional regulator [Actinoplanes regularis]
MPTTTDVSVEGALVASTFERLYEALRRLTPRDGLSLTAASTLRRLQRHGPHRLCALHLAEGVTQPAMTQLVTRLERDGLATRGPDPVDRRVVVVTITEAGRALVEQRRARYTTALAGVLDGLAAPDRAAIMAALQAMERLAEVITE